MLHSPKARIAPIRAAATARRQLAAASRPVRSFDASRYFRSPDGLRFHNVGMQLVRQMARAIVRENDGWDVEDALAFANTMLSDPYLEAKGVGIEVLARYRRQFTPRMLPAWKRWLTQNLSANWATTDAMCGLLIGPLLVTEPSLSSKMSDWSRDRNMWVRRASVVGLIPLVRKGLALDIAYATARRLHHDDEDLIQKAVGWMLREAGKADVTRLESYLRRTGPHIPRTTLRYAIERFPASKRRELLRVTRSKR